MAKKKTLRWRGMVTLLLLLALVVDALSGIILYITPAGSLARRTAWTFWGLSKDSWEDLHIVFSLVLLLILAGHLYFNWRMLSHFLWDKMRQVITLKRELAGALVLSLLIIGGTLWGFQPFRAIFDFRDTMKRAGIAGFVPGQGGGFGGRSADHAASQAAPDWNRQSRGAGGSTFGENRNTARGRGFGRRAYAQQSPDPRSARDSGALKGRDFVRLGTLATHSGILVKLGDEWGLESDGTVFEIHLGPAEYRASQGFSLTAGTAATVTGFVHNKDLSVTVIESGGRSLTLRDATGRPTWAGSAFSRGGGRGFPLQGQRVEG